MLTCCCTPVRFLLDQGCFGEPLGFDCWFCWCVPDLLLMFPVCCDVIAVAVCGHGECGFADHHHLHRGNSVPACIDEGQFHSNVANWASTKKKIVLYRTSTYAKTIHPIWTTLCHPPLPQRSCQTPGWRLRVCFEVWLFWFRKTVLFCGSRNRINPWFRHGSCEIRVSDPLSGREVKYYSVVVRVGVAIKKNPCALWKTASRKETPSITKLVIAVSPLSSFLIANSVFVVRCPG